ncbi:MAG: S8 family serine peptidase [Firmicutes bacterium]|nr:S8 family serine peptidase [Bacillota bacterium]MCM1400760.1 S8 family serine peptidase [Bacteroides sp.]MCM1477607.1 S8 family serine peptidase [Bacteroides sp.]
MKRILIAACTALAVHAFLPFGAEAQKLSPNAEILLENGHKKLSLQSATGESSKVETVSAFIAADDIAALRSALSELNININSEYDSFVTAVVPVDMLRQVSELPQVKYVSMSNPVDLRMDVARRETGIDAIHNNLGNVFTSNFTGKGVVIGMIDSGLEYDHLAFRDEAGNCRIRRVWDQNSSRGASPEGFDYGVEYTTPEQIIAATYDTSQEYHASHTTGIAGGSDFKSNYYGIGVDADIVFVSFDQEDAHVADAINYIFRYADEVGKPCVINMSLGSHFGPHNGTSMLDQAIDQAVGPGRIVVGAAGNEGEFNIHASKTFTETDTQMKTMLTFNANQSHKIHYLEVWGDPGTDFDVNACVVETLKGRIVANSRTATTKSGGENSAITVYELPEYGIGASIVIKAERNPVNDQPHASVQINVGEYNTGRLMGLVINGQAGQTINVWNASLHELASNGKPGWTAGTNKGTVGEIGGTAKRIITVGSYDSRSTFPDMNGALYEINSAIGFALGHRSVFSSCGPTVDGRTVPHILAPGMPVLAPYNSYAFMGADMTQYASEMTVDSRGKKYYYGYNMGTSMAAPVVAGTIALMLEARPDLTPEQALTYLQASTKRDAYMGQLPNNEYGYGRIDALETMKKLLNISAIDDVQLSDFGCKAWVDKGTGVLNIAVSDAHAGATATVYNTSGAKITDIELAAGLNTLNAGSWPHGIYLVQLPGSTVKIVL